MYGANEKDEDLMIYNLLLSPMYGANLQSSGAVIIDSLLSPMYGANKNKFYKYSYFSIRYIIKPIIT